MTIRPYTAADKQSCIEIFKSNMPVYFDPVELPEYEKWLDAQNARLFAGTEVDVTEQYFVVDLDEKVIACGGYHMDEDENLAKMTWGMVGNDMQRQGIGKMFFEYRIKTIRSQFPKSEIALDTTQHSYHFFEKLGFKIQKITEDYYAQGMHRYDMAYQG